MFSTRSRLSPYSMPTSTEANDVSLVMLTTLEMLELRITRMLPAPSLILVVRTPISMTVPLLPPTWMMSPTRNSPSKMMKSPAMMSVTRSLAPREMASVRRPAEASSVAVSTPSMARHQ